MSHDLYGLQSKGSDRARKAEAIARTCRLDAEDEAKAMSVYEGMLDALADRMARHAGAYAPKPALVYIAAYQHRYGVDLSAHASRDQAEARLLSIAWQQCMSDAAIRAAVDARFGPLVADEPPLEPPFESFPDANSDPFDDFAASDEAASQVRLDPMTQAAPKRSITAWDLRREGSGDAHHEAESDMDWQRTAAKPAPDREERRRTFCEQLLEEWPRFARGEALWIVECVIEEDDEPSRFAPEPEREPPSSARSAEGGAC
jgi:hypothetical protein